VVHEREQESRAEWDRGGDQSEEAKRRPAPADVAAIGGAHLETHEAHPGRPAEHRPETDEVAADRHEPQRSGRDGLRDAEGVVAGHDRADHERDDRDADDRQHVDDHHVDHQADGARHEAGIRARGRAGRHPGAPAGDGGSGGPMRGTGLRRSRRRAIRSARSSATTVRARTWSASSPAMVALLSAMAERSSGLWETAKTTRWSSSLWTTWSVRSAMSRLSMTVTMSRSSPGLARTCVTIRSVDGLSSTLVITPSTAGLARTRSTTRSRSGLSTTRVTIGSVTPSES